jgi:hypothetical protein
MKRNLMIISMVFCAVTAWGQENMFTVSGGYSFANVEDTENKITGWRINGLYEFNPGSGMLAHGLSFGYISLSGTDNSVTTTVNSFPLYYAPKLMFGNDRIKAFVKGALGMQFSTLKREGLVELSDHDFGFYGGGGAGVMIFIKENIFINGEYEIAWASNSYYKDGWINTAGGGIGFKF